MPALTTLWRCDAVALRRCGAVHHTMPRRLGRRARWHPGGPLPSSALVVTEAALNVLKCQANYLHILREPGLNQSSATAPKRAHTRLPGWLPAPARPQAKQRRALVQKELEGSVQERMAAGAAGAGAGGSGDQCLVLPPADALRIRAHLAGGAGGCTAQHSAACC